MTLRRLTQLLQTLEQIRDAAGTDNEEGGVFSLSLTRQPIRFFDRPSIQQGPIARNVPPMQTLNNKLGKAAAQIIPYAFPEYKTGLFLEQWAKAASIAIGHEDNHYVSADQFNISNIGEELAVSLGSFGLLHIDPFDDCTRLSVSFFLQNTPPTHFPGRFHVTGTRVTYTAAYLSALVFSCSEPHFGIPPQPYAISLPLDSPLKYQYPRSLPPQTDCPYNEEQRLVLVLWPEKDVMRPKSHMIHPEFSEAIALRSLGTMRNPKEYNMRTAIKDAYERGEDLRTADYWCEEFSWIGDNGQREWPRRWIASLCIVLDSRTRNGTDSTKLWIVSLLAAVFPIRWVAD
ncbi:hypothetical protein DL98DRAFT_603382 [Cadophora sp. DSE1049]|nr:hypothetical protein DL98DRAFT_603382 [Cadophora sp. DSE1049]